MTKVEHNHSPRNELQSLDPKRNLLQKAWHGVEVCYNKTERSAIKFTKRTVETGKRLWNKPAVKIAAGVTASVAALISAVAIAAFIHSKKQTKHALLEAPKENQTETEAKTIQKTDDAPVAKIADTNTRAKLTHMQKERPMGLRGRRLPSLRKAINNSAAINAAKTEVTAELAQRLNEEVQIQSDAFIAREIESGSPNPKAKNDQAFPRPSAISNKSKKEVKILSFCKTADSHLTALNKGVAQITNFF